MTGLVVENGVPQPAISTISFDFLRRNLWILTVVESASGCVEAFLEFVTKHISQIHCQGKLVGVTTSIEQNDNSSFMICKRVNKTVHKQSPIPIDVSIVHFMSYSA
ncbi:hypothetical protein PanWU01x14_169410 [Parasponia andersonii]|uniref:Uncharacterized protein n=1 Tax=Parasponia andersonii TaxID=3476 RepID=A0A2P5CAC3_PARAD|nr:hypothetical protein PanWU01x14_169410 [Parasponia andersonii]